MCACVYACVCVVWVCGRLWVWMCAGVRVCVLVLVLFCASLEYTFGRVYVPCSYSHARWSYLRRFRSLLLCPLSVESYYFPSFVGSFFIKNFKNQFKRFGGKS